jgi:hypothetical protein
MDLLMEQIAGPAAKNLLLPTTEGKMAKLKSVPPAEKNEFTRKIEAEQAAKQAGFSATFNNTYNVKGAAEMDTKALAKEIERLQEEKMKNGTYAKQMKVQ